MLRISADLFIFLVGFDHPVTKSNNTMGMIGNVFFMCYQYNSISPAMNFIKYLHDLIRGFCVKIPGWFICKNNCRVIYQCTGNRYTLALPATQFIWFMMAPVRKTYHIQYMLCFLIP